MTALAFYRTCKTTQRNFMRWKLKGTYIFGRQVDNGLKKVGSLFFQANIIPQSHRMQKFNIFLFGRGKVENH